MCHGFQQRAGDGDRLRIKAFTAQLSASISQLPDALTLYYLPRINGARIEVDGSDIRADSPAYVTLHRLWLEEECSGASYASRERVAVCEGVRFEIYVWDVRAVRGVFRKEEDDVGWRMECRADDVVEGVKGAEVAVESEGEVMREKVEMAVRRRRRRCCSELEEIPEVREEGEVGLGSDACGCSECSGDEGMDGGDCEMEVEGVGWAVDVGIWVVCLGVGYLVSRASSGRFIRRKRSSFV